MEIKAQVQLVERSREYRSKNGDRHETVSAIVVDVGEYRVTGVGLSFVADRDRDPDTFKAIQALKVDQIITVGVSSLRMIGGLYQLQGVIRNHKA